MTDTSTPKQREKTKPDTSYLREIAVFMIGYKTGKGDLNGIGLAEHHLTVLWDAISFINKSNPI